MSAGRIRFLDGVPGSGISPGLFSYATTGCGEAEMDSPEQRAEAMKKKYN